MILHDGSMCPGESCPKCRKARGEDNNPRIIQLDGAWQIIFRKGSKFASDEPTFAKGEGNG